MVICARYRRWRKFQIITTAFGIILIATLLSACGQSTTGQTAVSTSAVTPTPTPQLLTPTPTLMPTPTPTPTPEPPTPTPTPTITRLQGPTNFILNNTLNFSQASGTGSTNGVTYQLSSNAIEQSVVSTFQHTLFVVDSNNNITIYSSGSCSPISANTNTNTDGSVTISYNKSCKSGTVTFDGTLTGNQMKASYITNFAAGTVVNGQTFSGGSATTSTFTTQVRWVSSDQIPSAPTNGHYQLTSDGGVALTWSGNAAGYNIYRFVLIEGKGFQFVTKTSSTSYTDESPAATRNAQTIAGIAYAIYAVGPTGIENPSSVTISISSLGSLP